MLGLIWIGLTVAVGLGAAWTLYSMFMQGLSPGPPSSSPEHCGFDTCLGLWVGLWVGLTVAIPVLWLLS